MLILESYVSPAYGSKIKSFLKDTDEITQNFVYTVLERLHNYFETKCGGHIEGKRAIIHQFMEYKTLNLKVQTYNECDDYDMNIMKSIDAGLQDTYVGTETLNKNYYGVIAKIPKDMDKSNIDRKSLYTFCPLVGLSEVYSPRELLDRDMGGTGFNIIISVPLNNKVMPSNPLMKKKGSHYYFAGKNYTLEFDERDMSFTTTEYESEDSYDTYNTIYRPNRNAYKAFLYFVKEFNKNTTIGDVEATLKKFKIQLAHSYNFNPYVD